MKRAWSGSESREVCIGGDGRLQVSGQAVEKPGHVGGALDVRVTAQSVYAAAGASHISEEQLEHGRRANDLGAEGVLGPPDRVDDGRGFLHVAVFADRGEKVGGFEVLLFRNACDALHGLRRVARILLLEQLKYASGMLERQVVGDVRRQHRRRWS